MKIKRHFFILLFFMIYSAVLFGQKNEFKFWNTIEYGMRINHKWKVDFSQHMRLKENLSAVDNYITQFNVAFKPWNKWKLSAQFRYYRDNDNNGNNQGFDNLFRCRIGIEKQFKINPGIFNIRLAYQDRLSLDRSRFSNSQDWLVYGKRTKKVIRLKSSFEWKIKNWSYDPIFSFEYLPETRPNVKTFSFYSTRYGLGTNIKVSKTHSVSIRYFYEMSKYIKSEYFSSAHVISLKYMFRNVKKK